MLSENKDFSLKMKVLPKSGLSIESVLISATIKM